MQCVTLSNKYIFQNKMQLKVLPSHRKEGNAIVCPGEYWAQWAVTQAAAPGTRKGTCWGPGRTAPEAESPPSALGGERGTSHACHTHFNTKSSNQTVQVPKPYPDRAVRMYQ